MNSLTRAEVIEQCKMYVAACPSVTPTVATHSVSMQQGLKDLCRLPICEGMLNSTDGLRSKMPRVILKGAYPL